ncbi:MAG TPA: arginase family protein [Blastocatellia bacterium]|nr:arginase family protein [Blastocatellia bacterium]
MHTELSLLYPEWQGCGENACVYHGALRLAEILFSDEVFTRIEVPEREGLQKADGVLGLGSIVPRFSRALGNLRAASPARIFMIGGTCGVEVAPVGYLNERYGGDLAVVWFDAHGDLNTPDSSPSGHFHGMALRTLLGEGPRGFTERLSRFLIPEQIFLAGTRELDPPEESFIEDRKIGITRPGDFGEPNLLADQIRERGFSHLYLHLDLDVLNPDSFPDSLMPTAGGPTLKELEVMLRGLANSFDVVGFSIVEYCEREGSSIESLKNLVSKSGITIASTRALRTW